MNSIILPTYCPAADVEKKLHTCIQSIVLNTVDDYELIVIEQGIPAAHSMLPVRGKKKVTYVRMPESCGYARAVNIGASMASGDYLLIVNNDIAVGYEWDRTLTQAMASDPGLGLLSASDIPGPRTDIERYVSWWSCVCIPAAVWREVGPLDDINLNYRFHDQDWSIRAHVSGLCVARHHGVKVLHDESSTYRHMGIDETAERETMMYRWDCLHYREYIAREK